MVEFSLSYFLLEPDCVCVLDLCVLITKELFLVWVVILAQVPLNSGSCVIIIIRSKVCL